MNNIPPVVLASWAALDRLQSMVDIPFSCGARWQIRKLIAGRVYLSS
jgi:hypothetical protein